MNTPDRSTSGAQHLPYESRGEVAAAIDLGTQTALLIVAERGADGRLEVLEEHALSARLGEGLAATGRLDDGAIERTLEILAHYKRRIAQHGVEPERLVAVGTAVLRRATDAERFLELAWKRLGLAIEVLSGDEEARLGYSAVRELEAVGAEPALVDLGGGSVEVVQAGGEQRASLPFGAVTATEELRADGLGLTALDERLAGALSGLSALPSGAGAVAIGGTASNLASLVGAQPSFDPRLADGREVTALEALEWSERLAGLDLERRRDLGIEPDRAEILPAGLRILGRVLERLAPARTVVSGRGLRHALVARLLGDATEA